MTILGLRKYVKGDIQMEEITRIQRNADGNIISFQTSSGRIISYQKAVMEAQEGSLTGVNVELNGDGTPQLTNGPDSEDSFSDFPTIF